MLLSGVCPKHLFRTSDLPFYSNLKKLFYTYSTRIILVHSFPASCAAVYGAALPESEFDFKNLNLYYVLLDLDGPSGVLYRTRQHSATHHIESDQWHWVKPISLIKYEQSCKRDQCIIKLTIEYQELSHC